jgi:transcriptional regulator with XRE-family HTH domain
MSMMSTATVGERLRHEREGAHLSQEEVATRLGVSLRTYTRWERGESSTVAFLDRIEEIAEALETEPEAILGQDQQSDQTALLLSEINQRLIRLEEMVDAPKSRRSAKRAPSYATSRA